MVSAAVLMPERILGLVGADTLNEVEFKYTSEQIEQLLTPVRENFIETTRNFVRTMFPEDADPALVDRVVDDMSSAPPVVGKGALEGIFNFNKNNLLQVLKEVKAPIRCINSEMFPTKVDEIKRYVSSYEMVEMSGVGHFVMMEDPETFNRHLEEMIREFKVHYSKQ